MMRYNVSFNSNLSNSLIDVYQAIVRTLESNSKPEELTYRSLAVSLSDSFHQKLLGGQFILTGVLFVFEEQV